jgi:hypothetical protein
MFNALFNRIRQEQTTSQPLQCGSHPHKSLAARKLKLTHETARATVDGDD